MTLNCRQSVAFHDAMVACCAIIAIARVNTSVRCIEISRQITHDAYTYTTVLCKNIRLTQLSRAVVLLCESPRTRGVVAHSRDVTADRRNGGSARRTVSTDFGALTWDKSESSRILASMVTWLAWILGAATAIAATNRNVSIVYRDGSLGTGTRDNSPIHSRVYIYVFHHAPREWSLSLAIGCGGSITGRSSTVRRRRTEREWTRHWFAYARGRVDVARPNVLQCKPQRAERAIFLRANSRMMMNASTRRSRDRATVSPSLSSTPFLVSPSFSLRTLSARRVNDTEDSAVLRPLHAWTPLTPHHPCQNESPAWPARSRVSPSSVAPLPRARDAEHVTSPAFSYRDRVHCACGSTTYFNFLHWYICSNFHANNVPNRYR